MDFRYNFSDVVEGALFTGLSDIIIFAPITIYVGLLLLAIITYVFVGICKWNERRKRRKNWGE